MLHALTPHIQKLTKHTAGRFLAAAVMSGGIMLALSTSASTTRVVGAAEGESFNIASGAAGIIVDGSASASQSMAQWSNGQIKFAMNTPALSNVEWRLKGTVCSGAPRVELAVDGNGVGTQTINNPQWENRRTAVNLQAGRHTFSVRFVNDYSRPGCDRNVFLDKLTLLASGAGTAGNTGTATAESEITNLVSDVRSAAGHRYGARGNNTVGLDGLKIIENPRGGYIGLSHTLYNGTWYTSTYTSTDLLNWNYVSNIDSRASQPTIAQTPTGAFVVVYEQDTVCPGGGSCLKFRYYNNVDDLLAARYSKEHMAPRTLSPCAEGTPNIESIEGNTVRIRYHYYRNCNIDRQAIGTLTNFNSWSGRVADDLNNMFEALVPRINGNLGDRDVVNYKGTNFRIFEGQWTKSAWDTWRVYLMNDAVNSVKLLPAGTHGGSRGIGNPTVTKLRLPDGRPGIVVTYFIFSEGSAPGEAGELIFYKPLP